MEARFLDGDYVPDGWGGFETVTDEAETVQRILFKLTVRRGEFPLLPELGSRLWMLGQEKPSERVAAAHQYIAEALADENLVTESVTVTETQPGEFNITAVFRQDDDETVTVTAQI
jgi:hypothetical protein